MNKPDLGSIKPTCGQCKHWRLLWPDVCHVVAPGVVEFRGNEIAV
jgi:hypothetical protein